MAALSLALGHWFALKSPFRIDSAPGWSLLSPVVCIPYTISDGFFYNLSHH